MKWAILCGTASGLGLLTRYSSVLFIPLIAVTLMFDSRRSAKTRARLFVIVILVSLVVLNGFYLLIGGGVSLFPLATEPVVEQLRTEPLATLETNSIGRWLPLPLPRLYIEGLDLARYKNRSVEGPGYLNGRYSRDGWWSYFALALSMKTTLPFLVLSLAGLLLLLAPAQRETAPVLIAYILIPALGFFFLVTALTRAQIGLRYILPSLPFLCLLAASPIKPILAGIVPSNRRTLLPVAGLCLLLILHAAAAAGIHPYHLAYFNSLGGGPDSGYRHLVDSNLDWGQDLEGVRRFKEEKGLDGLNLYYFGTADPAYYGIRRNVPPRPGYYFVSVTHLMGVYLPDREMLAGFRSLTPETTIGHSILVYNLDEVPHFLNNPPNRP